MSICFTNIRDFERVFAFLSILRPVFAVLLLLAGRCYDAENWAFCSEMGFLHKYLFCKYQRSQILSNILKKPKAREFGFFKKLGHYLRSFYSALEAAIYDAETWVLCSSRDGLLHGYKYL